MVFRTLKIIGLFMVLMAGLAQAGDQTGRIAVAADAPEVDATVSEVAARAPFILIFGEDGAFVSSHSNPVTTDRRAGPALADWLADRQIEMLIAGRFGPKLSQALEARQIRRVVQRGPASEAVAAVLR